MKRNYYCGYGKLPKNKSRYGTYKECLNSGQVRRYKYEDPLYFKYEVKKPFLKYELQNEPEVIQQYEDEPEVIEPEIIEQTDLFKKKYFSRLFSNENENENEDKDEDELSDISYSGMEDKEKNIRIIPEYIMNLYVDILAYTNLIVDNYKKYFGTDFNDNESRFLIDKDIKKLFDNVYEILIDNINKYQTLDRKYINNITGPITNLKYIYQNSIKIQQMNNGFITEIRKFTENLKNITINDYGVKV